MAPNRKNLSSTHESHLEHLCRAGVPAPEAASRLKALGCNVSAATVGRRYIELRGNTRASAKAQRPRQAPRPVADRFLQQQVEADVRADVSAGPRDPRRVRAELAANLCDAETCEEVAAAELALARHEDPRLAKWLDEGDQLVSALVSAGHLLTLVNTPEAFADLARYVCETPGGIVREEGEPLAQYRRAWKAARDADQRRAVELLTGALAIVEATDPPNFPKDREP